MNNTSEYVRSQLNELLHHADYAAQNNQFGQVEEQLAQARNLASNIPELRQLVEQKAEALDDLRHSRLQEKLAQARQLLAGSEALNGSRLDLLLDQAHALSPDHPEVRALRDEAANKAAHLRERQVYDQTRQQCLALWQRERELLQANVSSVEILKECYEEAVQLAKRALSTRPGSLLLSGLVNEADREYGEARKRYAVKSTADETGNYKLLIDQLRKEQDHTRLIPWQDPDGNIRSPMTVAEARREAEQLAADYAYNKANEYLVKAQEYMKSYAPRAARNELERRRDLFMLGNDMVAVIEHYLEEEVGPALRKLEQAEQVLQQAEREEDAGNAWEFVDQAIDIYPQVPGAAEVRQKLLPRLANRAERFLQDGQRFLENDQLPDARPAAEEAQRFIERIIHYGGEYGLDDLQQHGRALQEQVEALLDGCRKEEALQQELVRAADAIEKKLKTNPGDAIRRWQLLVEEYGDENIERFPRLRRLRREVETHSGIAALLARLENDFNSNDAERTHRAITDVEEASERPENADFKNELLDLRQKLQGRLDYLLGMALLRDSGDVAKALPLLERVANQTRHPDSETAGREVRQIRSNEALAQRVDSGLRHAQEVMAKDPRAAYETLAPLTGALSLRRQEVVDLLDEARIAWSAKLVDEVNGELNRSRPHAGRLRDLANEIRQKLPEPRPIEVAENALTRAAALEAELQERAGEWEEAAVLWQEALTHDRLNPDYRAHWKKARKQVAQIKLDAAGDEEARGLFDDLEQEIPLDPEVREMRARYYLRRAESGNTDVPKKITFLVAAREALEAAREAASRPGVDTGEAFKGRLKDLEAAISTGEQISRRQAGVESKLQISNSLIEFSRAYKEALNLLATDSDSVVLADWWQETKAEAIAALMAEDSKLADEALWSRFDLRSKILALDRDHAMAQQLLRQLPVLATDISQAIGNLLQDRHQGLLIHDQNDMNVFEVQELETTQRRQQARAIYDMLSRFREHVRDPNTDALLTVIQNNLQELQGFLDDLGTLRHMKAQALSFLSQARINGVWDKFDRILRDFNQKGYNNHRAVEALRSERDRVQERRSRLLALRKRVVEAVEQEQFREAKLQMRIFEGDDELGDPQDDYGLRHTIQVRDPVSGEVIGNWRQLKKWLDERLAQIEQVASWLLQAGAGHILAAQNVPTPGLGQVFPAGIISWEAIAIGVRHAVEAGQFSAGRDQVLTMIEGNDGWYDHSKRLLSLSAAAGILERLPFTNEEALSKEAKQLLQVGTTFRERTLLAQIETGRQVIAWISAQRAAWLETAPELDQSFRELETLYNKGWLWRRRHPEELTTAATRVRTALLKCQAISPNHPNLLGIENHPLLRDGK